MCNESEKNKLSIDEFIAMVDSFFVLWEDKDDFRSNLIIYMAVLKQIKDFAENDSLYDNVQAKFNDYIRFCVMSIYFLFQLRMTQHIKTN